MSLGEIDQRGALSPTASEDTAGRFTILMLCTGNLCRSRIAQAAFAQRFEKSLSLWSANSAKPSTRVGRGAEIDQLVSVPGTAMTQLFRDVPLVPAPIPLASQFRVASAGTRINPSLSVPDATYHECDRLGVPGGVGAPVAVNANSLARADLVLGMTREHRRAAAVLLPRASSRSFTLIEFARILNSLAATPPTGAAPSFDGTDLAGFLVNVRDGAIRRRGLVPPLDRPHGYDIEDPYGRAQPVFERVGTAISSTIDSIVADLGLLASR